MLGIHPRGPLATLTAIAGLLAVAGPADATATNLHAGEGRIQANASTLIFIAPERFMDYTDDSFIDDGTAHARRDLMVDRHDARVFSGDAHDNEMGITDAGDNAILMADMGGQFSAAAAVGGGGHGTAGDGSKVPGFVAPQTDPRASAPTRTASGP